MRKIVFDIETKNIFSDIGTNDPAGLDISVLSLYDSKSQKYYSFTEEEFGEMWTFFEKADLLITYNGTHFDIPVLQKYCPFDLKSIPHLDIFTEIQDSINKKISLNNIAISTLKISKSANGLDAVAWWNSGEIDKIKRYCEQDVLVTKDIYEFAKKNNFLKYTDRNTKEEKKIELTSENWEKRPEIGASPKTLF